MQHTITAVLLVRRGYPRWLLSDGKPRDESRIMNSLPGEWAAFQNSKGAGVHDGVGNNKAYVTPDEMLTALRRDREAFQQYLKDPTLVAEDQRKAFKELIEVSDTIARPKGKGRDNRAEADTDPAGTFALAKAELDRNAATTQSSDGGPSLTPSLDPVRKGPPVA
jgi:hypothetical protein